MQTNIQFRPNTVRVIDCIQFILQQIKPGAGDFYFTDGMVVDRNRDPRRLLLDQDAGLRKYGTLVRIKEGDSKKATGSKGFVGATSRTVQHIELICVQLMADAQDRAGVTIDMLQGWLRHDIEVALGSDDVSGATCIQRATPLMNQVKGPWGDVGTFGPPPSCIDMEVMGHLAGSIVDFPGCHQTVIVSYIYDEYGLARRPGSSPGDIPVHSGFDEPMYP
jgi:hypothetical protein